jgi:ketosteroid isomerase-like protein
LSFNLTRVEVAQTGDLAYEEGTYQLTMKNAQGSSTTTPGKYVAVWKKQLEGNS